MYTSIIQGKVAELFSGAPSVAGNLIYVAGMVFNEKQYINRVGNNITTYINIF